MKFSGWIVFAHGRPQLYTLAAYRFQAVRAFMERQAFTWRQLQKIEMGGCTVERVEVMTTAFGVKNEKGEGVQS